MSETGPGQPGATPPPPPPGTPPPGTPAAPAPASPPTWPTPPPATPPPAPPAAPTAPGWNLPPGPAPRGNRHSRAWVFVLVGVVTVLVVGTIVGIALGVDVFSKPVDATNQYYANVRAHRYRAAYNELCTTRRVNLTFPQFVAEQRRHDRISGPLRSYDFFVGVVAGDDGRAVGQEHRNNDRDVTVHLDKEGDVWKVCTINTR